MNETRTLFREACVEYGTIQQKLNQIKVKAKEVNITGESTYVEQRNNDLGWLGDESVDEVIENASAPTVEEIENKLKA